MTVVASAGPVQGSRVSDKVCADEQDSDTGYQWREDFLELLWRNKAE